MNIEEAIRTTGGIRGTLNSNILEFRNQNGELETRVLDMEGVCPFSQDDLNSLENLIFKELRNRGYLDKFTDYIHNIEDHQLTYK